VPTESYSNIQEGALTKGAIVEEFVASAAILLWSPVITAAVGTNETMPRVAPNASLGQETVIGVAVGPKRSSGKAADAAGDSVQVCIWGLAKCRVDGNAANISIGDVLQTGATGANGDAEKVAPYDAPATVNEANLQAEFDLKANKGFAKALKASTVDGDIIPVIVGLGQGLV